MVAENMMIENSPVHLAWWKLCLMVARLMGSCLSVCHLAGKSENATSNPMTSIMSAILNGKIRLILVKNGKAIMKNTLNNDTRHLIDEDILLN